MSEAWGEPPWNAAIETVRVPPPVRVDVAVIGAGLTGLAAAQRLAGAGLSVAVLEAGRVGSGASGRTGGLALEGAAAGELEGIDDCLPSLARRVRDEGIVCELQLDGCLELTHAEPADDARHRLAWRDGEGVLRVVDEVEGGTLDPRALLAGLLRGALEAGAVVCEHTRVVGIECRPSPRLHLGARTLACDRALVALNAYTADLVPEVHGLRAALSLALATGPLPDAHLAAIGLGARHPFYTVDLPYLWGRVLPGGALIFGAGLAFAPQGSPLGLDVLRGEPAQILARLERRVRALHPQLAEVVVTTRWGGPVCFREGGVPVLAAHPASERVVVTGAYAGHGVALSLRAGEIAAEALLGRRQLPAWGAL